MVAQLITERFGEEASNLVRRRLQIGYGAGVVDLGRFHARVVEPLPFLAGSGACSSRVGVAVVAILYHKVEFNLRSGLATCWYRGS